MEVDEGWDLHKVSKWPPLTPKGTRCLGCGWAQGSDLLQVATLSINAARGPSPASGLLMLQGRSTGRLWGILRQGLEPESRCGEEIAQLQNMDDSTSLWTCAPNQQKRKKRQAEDLKQNLWKTLGDS